MRGMMINVVTVLLFAAFLNVNAQANSIGGPVVTDVLNIMKEHFDRSINYLYTGFQYESQYGERPGLGKKLRGMSDAHWEAGMSALNKYLEHSGTINDNFVGKLDVRGKGQANLDENSKGEQYMETLRSLETDSVNMLEVYNSIYTKTIKDSSEATPNSPNSKIAFGDIAHYLEEKIEEEIKHHHELKGQIKTLGEMKGIGAAVAAFDSNM